MSRLVSTTDRTLIRLLQQNARMSFAELSRVTGIPESTVRRRVERLQDRGIIRFAMIADADQLGYEISAMIGLRVDIARLPEIGEFLAEMSEVVFASFLTGSFDILAQVVVESQSASGGPAYAFRRDRRRPLVRKFPDAADSEADDRLGHSPARKRRFGSVRLQLTRTLDLATTEGGAGFGATLACFPVESSGLPSGSSAIAYVIKTSSVVPAVANVASRARSDASSLPFTMPCSIPTGINAANANR